MDTTIFERLKLWRNRRDLTQDELAVKAKVSRNSISMMERGEYNPTLEQINKVAKALELELLLDVKEWESYEDVIASNRGVCDCGEPFLNTGYCQFCGAYARYGDKEWRQRVEG